MELSSQKKKKSLWTREIENIDKQILFVGEKVKHIC